MQDQAARIRALTTTSSFIVQAPAGSGKTTLLVQRYLALLGQVEAPEDILAITFTRKAAQEMRERVIASLNFASSQQRPSCDHEQVTYDLAKKALHLDTSLNWQLTLNVHRCRIQTFDAFSAQVVKQLPVLSELGASGQIAKAPDKLYDLAAMRLLNSLESNQPWANDVGRLLQHLDNNLEQAHSLLKRVLAIRDQWMVHLIPAKNQTGLKAMLQEALLHTCSHTLKRFYNHLSADQRHHGVQFINYISTHLVSEEQQAFKAWPDPLPANIDFYLAFVDFCLQKSHEWRKRLTLKEGFPAPSNAPSHELKNHYKNMKEQAANYLLSLSEDDTLKTLLQDIRFLPVTHYSEPNWQLLSSLLNLLPVLVAELKVVFKSENAIDFIAIAEAALLGLGEEDAPSELAFKLDNKIEHILVDEYQDTSLSQYRLLTKLVSAWQPNDGRTLFLVGDPMQSIYRFRHAEVGLFIKTAANGLGSINLESLVLQKNFRSTPAIIDWVNQIFKPMMPEVDNVETGAVSFTESVSGVAEGRAERPMLIGQLGFNGINEARALILSILSIKKQFPDESVAILVQARSHLSSIIPMLKEQELDYRAIEIEGLSEHPAIQDLISLTLALAHKGDRLSWLAILRAPWCGLSLNALHALVAEEPDIPVWTLIKALQPNDTRFANDDLKRLSNFTTILERALSLIHKKPFYEIVEQTWYALGGPATVDDTFSQTDSRQFFQLIRELPVGEQPLFYATLEEQVARYFATPISKSDNPIELMTIHKAKGLEFDHVFIPGLGLKHAPERHSLFMLAEVPRENKASDLIVAPLQTDPSHDSIYQYLRRSEKQKIALERVRLFYVAATRAKQQLYLFGHLDETSAKPPAGSLMAHLWPAVGAQFDHLLEQDDEVSPDHKPNQLARLKINFVNPISIAKAIDLAYEPAPTWSPPFERIQGTVMHSFLEQIANEGLDTWTEQHLAANKSNVELALKVHGLAGKALSLGLETVMNALQNTLACKRGRWILTHHQQAESEYPLSILEQGAPKQYIIDRTFIDEKNQRWIIDYKLAHPGDQDKALFLAKSKAQYQPQLEGYAKLFQTITPQTIHLGLYFPLWGGWITWEYQTCQSTLTAN